MAVFQETFSFRDRKGMTSTVTFYTSQAGLLAADTAMQAIFTDIQPLSCALLYKAKGPTNTPPNAVAYPPAVAGEPYIDVEDKMVLTATTAAGSLHRWQIPAPLRAGFLGDDRTVDFTNGAVSAFVAAVVANCCDRNGIAITAFLGGFRASRPQHRRFNIITRNPTLSGQGL